MSSDEAVGAPSELQEIKKKVKLPVRCRRLQEVDVFDSCDVFVC